MSSQREMVQRVERELLGTRGVVRYLADGYHACGGGPPEWTMGLGLLALAWNSLGEHDRAVWYSHRLQSVSTATGGLPESWCHDPSHDEFYNCPLCWSHALHVVAAVEIDGRRASASPGTIVGEAPEPEARGA